MTTVNLSRKLRLARIDESVVAAITPYDIRQVRQQWWLGDNVLLTPPEGQTKGHKTAMHGDLLAVLHLHADRLMIGDDMVVTCEKATHGPDGCADNCIMWTGRGMRAKSGKETAVAAGRRKRTEWLMSEPFTFMAQLDREIRAHRGRALRRGMRPVVRLNGTSDLAWEHVVRWLFGKYPDVYFFDYTKLPVSKRGPLPDNYYLAWSAQAHLWSVDHVLSMAADGRNVSVIVDHPGEVVRLKACVSGDTADTWMIGQHGKLGILKPKLPLRADHATVYRAADLRPALIKEGAMT